MEGYLSAYKDKYKYKSLNSQEWKDFICQHFAKQVTNFGRFTFERIHNTKEQIIFYERAEKHKSKERTILSLKRALFPGNDQSGKWQMAETLNLAPFLVSF